MIQEIPAAVVSFLPWAAIIILIIIAALGSDNNPNYYRFAFNGESRDWQ